VLSLTITVSTDGIRMFLVFRFCKHCTYLFLSCPSNFVTPCLHFFRKVEFNVVFIFIVFSYC
jgi:hypothetical protein